MNVNSKKLEVKHKRAADIQITAEQLINEAFDIEENEKEIKYNLIDEDELNEYKLNKRKEFEDKIRKRRYLISTYIKYAIWEVKQNDMNRARSIFERAINIDYSNKNLWLKYIEMELINKNINSARNLFERVILLLPLENIFWKKYAHLEELLNNFMNARIIYERWIKWKIDETSFLCYINFEERCKEINRCREIFEKLLVTIPKLQCFYKCIKFEKKYKNIERARCCFEKCIELLPASFLNEDFYIAFCDFEEENNEYERCKHIYIEALKRLSKENSKILYNKFLQFQKKFSSKEELNETILLKERIYYEQEIKKNPNDYDIWFDYIKIEELNITNANKEKSLIRIRELYEKAISIIPLISTKKYWKRYIYLWFNYAIFEELYAENIERARNIYKNVIKILNNQNFTFKKAYILYATFELRQLNIDKVRKIYNKAIQNIKNEKIFQHYCDTELRLGNIDECRKIYEQFVQTFPFNPKVWISMINFEISLEEIKRARYIAETALKLDEMKLPELIWKCYIDMEINLNEYNNVEKLYKRLLNITQHYKVYKSYSEFVYIYFNDINKCREILENGIDFCKKNELINERFILLNFLYQVEKDYGDQKIIEKTYKRLPKKVKKKIIKNDQIVEEYITYVFPDDGIQSNMKIFQKAIEWKQKLEQQKNNIYNEKEKEYNINNEKKKENNINNEKENNETEINDK